MPSLKLILCTIFALLLSTVQVSAKERFRIKFFRFAGANCEKMIDNEGSSKKASHSQHSADCHEYKESFDSFMYYWQEHHFRGQSGSMEFGKCQIMVYSDNDCKKDVVYHLAAANLQHNFEQCASLQGRKGQSFKIWCDDWPTIGHHHH